MGTVYKIHPALGVARVGNHQTAFFVGPETPGTPGMEIGADGSESPVTAYKADGRIKRQAARFRVFAYEQDPDGTLHLTGEVGPETHVEWSVDLVNRKAALDRKVEPAGHRNPLVTDRDSLVIRGATTAAVSGSGAGPTEVSGSFLGANVYLGEIRTDSAGRLIVLGGRGTSASVPPGLPMTNFVNNDGWHDDVADGPVRATVTRPGESPVAVHQPAWVLVAPPDFAPSVDSTVSLYDIARQRAVERGTLRPATSPSFTHDIRPLIERTMGLRWVDDWNQWVHLAGVDWMTLADPSPAAQPARATVAADVKNPQLTFFELPEFLERYVDQWAAGDFVSDLGAPTPAEPLPDQLDRASLERCTGNNFYPGIEGGQTLKDLKMYDDPPRLDHGHLTAVYPGCLTEVMAVPWQADFYDCRGGSWWPTQRPDHVMLDPNDVPGSAANWANPVNGYQSMVDHVHQLGFVVPQDVGGQTVLVESERDPQFPRP